MSCHRTSAHLDEDEGHDHDSDHLLLNPRHLHVHPTPNAGLGVFSNSSIPVGTVIERAPVLVLTRKEWEDGKLDSGVLGGYAFTWVGGAMAIGLGIASMFNHSSNPNTSFIRSIPTSTNPSIRPSIIFRTFKYISPGDELTICYSADESKLWFSPNYNNTNTNNTTTTTTTTTSSSSSSSSSFNDPSTTSNQLASSSPPTLLSLASFPIDTIPDPIAASQAERKERRKRDREEKQKRYDEKVAERDRRKKGIENNGGGGGSGGGGGGGGGQEGSRGGTVGFGNGGGTFDNNDRITGNSSSTSGINTPNNIPTTTTTTPLNEEDYLLAITRLNLVSEITIPPDDEEEEIELIEMENGTDDGTMDGKGSGWRLIPRVKGSVEMEMDDDTRMMDVWTIGLSDTKMFKVVLDLIRNAKLPQDDVKHLKRIKRESTTSPNGHVILCPATYTTHSSLVSLIHSLSPSLASHPIEIATVPAACANTLSELTTKNLSWPVVYIQRPPSPVDLPWSAARRVWVRRAIDRIVNDALIAQQQGELPIATHVTCPPIPARIVKEGDIPPTPNIRASAHDTRQSANHPLKHAALACIANIARLRTVWPATATLGTRNGADYLLTSLSLFITHEPCLMCTMALLHSRVKEIYYILPSADGGFNSTYGVHGHPQLNHQVDVFDCSALVDEDKLHALALPSGCNV